MIKRPSCVGKACRLLVAAIAIDLVAEAVAFGSATADTSQVGAWFAMKVVVDAICCFLIWKIRKGSNGARSVVVNCLFVIAPLAAISHVCLLVAGHQPVIHAPLLVKWILASWGTILLASRQAVEWFVKPDEEHRV